MPAVRPVAVTLVTDGDTFERTYLPGSLPYGQQAFNEFAVGNLIALAASGYTDTFDNTDSHLAVTGHADKPVLSILSITIKEA